MEDKRRFPRHAAVLDAAYAIGGGQQGRIVETATVNVSRGGCTLVMPGVEKPGSRILVHLVLPSGDELSVLGTVAWVREAIGGQRGSLGVAFEGTAALPEVYLAYLDRLEPNR